MTVENESIFEEYEPMFSLQKYVILKENEETYAEDGCYLLQLGNESISFVKGNYSYAVGTDGEVYIKALNNGMAQD